MDIHLIFNSPQSGFFLTKSLKMLACFLPNPKDNFQSQLLILLSFSVDFDTFGSSLFLKTASSYGFFNTCLFSPTSLKALSQSPLIKIKIKTAIIYKVLFNVLGHVLSIFFYLILTTDGWDRTGTDEETEAQRNYVTCSRWFKCWQLEFEPELCTTMPCWLCCLHLTSMF